MEKIIILNHKSDLKLKEAKEYALNINDVVRSDQKTIICPSSTYLPYYNGKYRFKLGAQDISEESITGEITGEILKSLGVSYTLIAHHERKNKLKEDKKQINNKIKKALENNIIPIVILGETFYENKMKKTGEIIRRQIKDYFENIEVKEDIILVYEPNYSFKGKEYPTLESIEEVIDLIKTIMIRKYNIKSKVLYGGNVNKDTIKNLNKIKNIDGFLIGKSSILVKEVKMILNELD